MAAEILLDVREMEPPEPLQKVLGILDTLPEGHYLRVVHRRDPHCLLELVERLGFVHAVRAPAAARFDVFVWREADNLAALAVQSVISA